ncbi:MAG: DUF2058 family protein [Xanthomonadales bacterium]|nr:DUF2058 family protein [Xanthomonadales bacterium]
MGNSLSDALRQSGVLANFKPVPDDSRGSKDAGKGGGPGRRREGARPDKDGRRHQAAGKGAAAKREAGRNAGGDGGKARTPGKHQRPSQPRPARDGGEIDLAKAYALRSRSEQREREEKLRAEREVAEQRRRLREQVLAVLDGKTLNLADAEQVRNFEYGGKIRRVYVSDEQLEQLNRGDLGVVQVRGRYLLVTRALAEQVAGIDANALALLPEPGSVGPEAGSAAAGDDEVPAAG